MEMTAVPRHDYPEKMFPLIRHHYNEKSLFFSMENITHYVRVIMFGCYNVATKNVIDALDCGEEPFGVHATPREYLTARNLFDNELLVVTILCTALSLASIYSNFMQKTCNGEYKLIHVNREDRVFYRNMLLFIFTGLLLERARSKGINPDIEGDPEYFGFHQEDVDRYGYYFLFLRNLPRYAAEIWDSEKADYIHLMHLKEKCKREKELAAEADEESDIEVTHPGATESADHDSTVAQWKNIKKYTFDKRDLGQLMRINLKISVKHVAKTSPKPNKCDPTEWDALPWDGVEKDLEDVQIHPCISRLWRALFSRQTKTPLQKLMVAVNSQSISDSRSET
jgi:hypothetical protein